MPVTNITRLSFALNRLDWPFPREVQATWERDIHRIIRVSFCFDLPEDKEFLSFDMTPFGALKFWNHRWWSPRAGGPIRAMLSREQGQQLLETVVPCPEPKFIDCTPDEIADFLRSRP